MESYAVGVVAHISRLDRAQALAGQVGAELISVDDGRLGCEVNHRTVWEHLAAKPTDFSVILEDDAVPVAGFTDQLRQALPNAPTPIISLYLGRQRPPWAQDAALTAIAEAERTQADWIISSHLLHAVGYAIPTAWLPSLIDFRATGTPVDQHITVWAPTLVSYTWGSLVDHADIPTVVTHPDGQPRSPGRVAWKSAPHPSWSSRSVIMEIT